MSSLVIETPANISVIKDRFGLFPNPQEVQTMGQVIAQIEELLDPANPAHTLKEATSGKAQED
jgi:predicted metallo-beta-lactamase superfamily hydrolase